MNPAGDADDHLRAALAGADTLVWEWDIASDRLPDLGRSLQALGYPEGAVEHTQAAWDALIHPDDLDANEAAYQRHVRGETEVYEHTYRVRDVHGRWRWKTERGRIVERDTQGRPLRMVGIETDITGRREAEAAAEAARARLEQIAGHVPGVLYEFEVGTDGRARFRYMSERSGELMGVPAAVATAAGADALSSVHRDDLPAVRAAIAESARTMEPWRQEFRLRRPDGQVRWVAGSSTPRRADGGRVIWYGYLQDVTEAHELAEARRSAEVAAAASRAKSEFLSRMSHELRTPLNAVLGFTQLMEADPEDPPSDGQRRRLQHIRQAGDHLLQMIGELLDLTRIESGTLAVALADVPLREVAAEALALVETSAAQAQVQLQLQVSGEPVARADRQRLRQVLVNLLSNAIKYNRVGGRVDLVVGPGARSEVRLEVRDDGQGIAEPDLPRLFEPFHRGRQSQGSVEGTGIGLSLSRSLVLAMSGRIEAHSRAGAGSTFIVTLPAAGASLQ